MSKVLILALLLCNSAFANKAAIIKSLAPHVGKIDPKDITKTPLDGVFQVVTREPLGLVFISKDGRFIISSLIDLKTKTAVGADTLDQLKRIKNKSLNAKNKRLIDGVKDADKIIFKADKEKHSINVFTDVDCPYCARLHAEMDKMNNLGISVKYMASPIASLHPKAQSKMEKIWCADDRIAAMDNYKKFKIVPKSKACINPVAEQVLLSNKVGVRGTPAIFLEDGSLISGYLKANDLLKKIKLIQK